MYSIKHPLNRCYDRGYADFFAGNTINPYALTPDGQMSMSAKDWEHGFNVAYNANLKRIA